METKEEVVALDEYEIALQGKLADLISCQKEKSFKSCRECQEFYSCDIRKTYVDAVFISMSKGETGGFEF